MNISVSRSADKASGENRESGANPERYRHCKCGGPGNGESRSLERSEKAPPELWMHKSGDLLKWFPAESGAASASRKIGCGDLV